ncbi:MAG TPA: aminopeptidase [Candidatus Nitrosotalea sp.]|nr:aminopeptidase [Candidatus Nitrosotalea sp.]
MAVLLISTVGCHSLGYYSQAIHGHFQIVCRTTSIKKLLADPQTPESLKERFQLVLDLREFAGRELKLPPDGQYLTYADLGRRFAVWNVYAAPEFSLKAKTWWYPFVGSLKYQGYFTDERARRYAEKLSAKGYDAFVGGVEAYSTLGWFKDPVLNTFIHNDDLDLAELLFHELAHERVFISGDTDFNEAFATAVAEEGVRTWLKAKGKSSALEQYEAELRRKQQFVDLVCKTRDRLNDLYDASRETVPSGRAAAETQSIAELRAKKQSVFKDLRQDYQQLKQSWNGDGGYDEWFRQPLNNAHLNDVDTYYTLVPAFHRILQSHHGDWEKFYREIEHLGKLSEDARRKKLLGTDHR